MRDDSSSERMKAMVFRKYGPPEVIRMEETARPEPAAGQVLVKVRSSAVSDWDWSFVRGKPYVYPLFMGLPRPKVGYAATDEPSTAADRTLG